MIGLAICYSIGEENGFCNSSSVLDSDISETDNESYDNNHVEVDGTSLSQNFENFHVVAVNNSLGTGTSDSPYRVSLVTIR